MVFPRQQLESNERVLHLCQMERSIETTHMAAADSDRCEVVTSAANYEIATIHR